MSNDEILSETKKAPHGNWAVVFANIEYFIQYYYSWFTNHLSDKVKMRARILCTWQNNLFLPRKKKMKIFSIDLSMIFIIEGYCPNAIKTHFNGTRISNNHKNDCILKRNFSLSSSVHSFVLILWFLLFYCS